MTSFHKLSFAFLLIFLLFGLVFAQNQTQAPECTKEGESFPIYPGHDCCDGLIAIKPTASLNTSTGECTPIVGSSVCSNCGNGTCEKWENQCNCLEDCSQTPIIPKDCISWYDGCNNCTVENGKLSACTRMYCEKYQEPKCLQYQEPIIPKDCISWYDGCNTCQVKNEEILGCTKRYCIQHEEPKCLLYETDIDCICPTNYDPVCAEVEICETSCKTYDKNYIGDNNYIDYEEGCSTTCFTQQKTFGNECEANCAKAKIISKGECTNSCPIYTPPYCPNGEIISEIDERGCSRPICNDYSQSNFFKYAKWSCADGSQFSEGSENSCKPYAYWKETARQKCESIIQPCMTSTSTQSTTNSTSTQSTNNTESKTCTRQNNYVTSFDVSTPCDNNCKSYTDKEGCRVVACGNENPKKYCGAVCVDYSYETIKEIKENCYSKSGNILVQMDDAGCTSYVCQEKTNTDCITHIDDIPKEKYITCEENGGKIVSKTDTNGCVLHFECVRVVKNENATINKKILNDSTKLLELALKLETLKLEINKTIDKTKVLAEYYTNKGDTNSALKFNKATELLGNGIIKIDEVKKLVKENVNNFSENNAIQVRETIKEIKETILNEVLMVLLE